MKVAFATLGCRVNQYETEAMTEKFILDGYEVVAFEEFADVYVINTCTVTNMGDKKSRQMISRARKLNGDSVIAVVGCYSQIQPENVARIDGVDIVLGTRNKGDIVEYVKKCMKDRKKIIEVNEVLKNNKFEDLKIEKYQNKTRAFLKIQDGCNKFCSYCLIPFARGGICSKDPKILMSEAEKLAEHGFKEIILSGIHTASYGIDLKNDWSLIKVIEEINKIEGIERIRIGSIDPTFFNEDVIKRISNIEKLCPHFHLSLQSGCDRTLERMNRHYDTALYRKITEELRESIKDVSITTDVIVGFPGESEDEFNETYAFLRDIKLSRMHIFKYSPREGTKAAAMKDQISGNIKDERSSLLEKLNKELEYAFMSRFIGRNMNVLYEQHFDNSQNIFEGYTPNYIKVVSEFQGDLRDKIMNTEIMSIENEHMLGSICNKK